ncbi:hypothetical protein IFR05_006911 [Cadophora sp. M221]|nr:hypothetical protein IFR05_006911 [Cadophora sp. M221]
MNEDCNIDTQATVEIDERFEGLLKGFPKIESDMTIGFLDSDWERRSVNPQGSLNRILKFVSLDQESCYYSSISRKGGNPVLEICYNACESLSFDINEQSPSLGPRSVILDKKPLPLYFRYDIRAKKAIYILGNAPCATETAIRRFSDLALETGQDIHPFALHLITLQSVISIRDAKMTYNLKSLLLIEDALLDGSLMATQSLEKFRQQTQELHELSRSMIITEHYNDRDLSNLRNLMRDMERLEKEGAKIANLDSMASLKIAEESTKIAQETRKDGMSMKTIATLSMLYLPASFVCSVFGTNFFALDTDGGERSFVVSNLWWIIVVVAVPVTLVTYGAWLWWMRRGESGKDVIDVGNQPLRRKESHEC